MHRVLSAVVALAALVMPFHASATGSGSVRYVDNVAECEGLSPCYGSVTDAVSAAASGDVISVFPGVYHEAVTISFKDDLVLKAQRPAQPPRIVAPAGSAITISFSSGAQISHFVLESPDSAGVSTVEGVSERVVVADNVVRAPGGIALGSSFEFLVQNNVVLGGGIDATFGTQRTLIEGNTVIDGFIFLADGRVSASENVIRRNFVQGGRGNRGGIAVSAGHARDNVIESNFVSGSPTDGISVFTAFDSGNVIRRNTAVENAECDINDATREPLNVWKNNRFGTKCGFATD